MWSDLHLVFCQYGTEPKGGKIVRKPASFWRDSALMGSRRGQDTGTSCFGGRDGCSWSGYNSNWIGGWDDPSVAGVAA